MPEKKADYLVLPQLSNDYVKQVHNDPTKTTPIYCPLLLYSDAMSAILCKLKITVDDTGELELKKVPYNLPLSKYTVELSDPNTLVIRHDNIATDAAYAL